MARVSGDPYQVNDLNPTQTPGMIFDGVDNTLGLPAKFRYVQFEDAVTYVAGHACTFSDATLKQVTNDISGGSSLGTMGAGLALRVMTQNYYGYVLVQGYHPSALGDGSVAAGESVMIGAADGVLDTQTAAGKQVGVALTDDAPAFPGYFNFL